MKHYYKGNIVRQEDHPIISILRNIGHMTTGITEDDSNGIENSVGWQTASLTDMGKDSYNRDALNRFLNKSRLVRFIYEVFNSV